MSKKKRKKKSKKKRKMSWAERRTRTMIKSEKFWRIAFRQSAAETKPDFLHNIYQFLLKLFTINNIIMEYDSYDDFEESVSSISADMINKFKKFIKLTILADQYMELIFKSVSELENENAEDYINSHFLDAGLPAKDIEFRVGLILFNNSVHFQKGIINMIALQFAHSAVQLFMLDLCIRFLPVHAVTEIANNPKCIKANNLLNMANFFSIRLVLGISGFLFADPKISEFCLTYFNLIMQNMTIDNTDKELQVEDDSELYNLTLGNSFDFWQYVYEHNNLKLKCIYDLNMEIVKLQEYRDKWQDVQEQLKSTTIEKKKEQSKLNRKINALESQITSLNQQIKLLHDQIDGKAHQELQIQIDNNNKEFIKNKRELIKNNQKLRRKMKFISNRNKFLVESNNQLEKVVEEKHKEDVFYLHGESVGIITTRQKLFKTYKSEITKVGGNAVILDAGAYSWTAKDVFQELKKCDVVVVMIDCIPHGVCCDNLKNAGIPIVYKNSSGVKSLVATVVSYFKNGEMINVRQESRGKKSSKIN